VDEIAMLSLVARELVPAMRAVLLLQETQRLASTDVLTGLLNRRSGGEALKTAMTVAVRYGIVLSVAMLDLDHFKHVNDTYGHAVGDVTLQQVAKVLRTTTRAADSLVRWGGEEFLVLMPSTGMTGGRIAGERIRRAIAAAPVCIEGGRSLEVTVSIGLATCEKEESADELVDRADKALYAAKRRGRNRVEVA
jgi:two-component system cell cycle response regulator